MTENKEYGIGPFINDEEDWKKFVTLYNKVVDALKDAKKYEKLDMEFKGDASALPGYVAITTVSLDDLKANFETEQNKNMEWMDLEAILTIIDCGYPLCAFRV